MLLPAIFLDRDGTLIVDRGYLRDPALVEFETGVVAGLRQLECLGFPLVGVSNQSGIGRGHMAVSEAEAVNRRTQALFLEAGIRFSGWYTCPHSPETACECRKPKIGMALTAASELGLDLTRSFVIGDKRSDVEMGENFGGRGILLKTGQSLQHTTWARENGCAVCADLKDAADCIPGNCSH